MTNLSDEAEKEVFWGNLFFELVYFVLALIFEDRFSNIFIFSNEEYTIMPITENTLRERIIIMSNAHLLKILLIMLALIIYLLYIYFSFLFSQPIDKFLEINFKSFFSSFYVIILIIIADICPYLFIYPYISKYTSVYCMPVHWNISQYILILTIFSQIYYSSKFESRAFWNSIIFSIISFIIQVISFSNFYFTRDSAFGNYFNDSISILIFFFAPMFMFMKEYLYSYLLLNPYDKSISPFLILAIWILEEIIYLVLRIIFVSPHNLFFGEYSMKSTFSFLLTTYHDIGDICFLMAELNLATKGFLKSISHLGWWVLDIFGFWMAYKPIGYVLFTLLTTTIDLINYILLITLQSDNDIFDKMYDINLYININFITDEKKKTNLATIPQKKSSYNQDEEDSEFYEQKVSELKSEKSSIINSKSSLENQIISIRNSSNDLKVEIGTLKIKNKKLKDENGRLINELAQKEKLLNDLKKEK